MNCYNIVYEHSCRRAEGWASGCRSRRGGERCQCSPAPALRCSREWADNSLHQPAAKCVFALLPRPTHGYRQRSIDTCTLIFIQGKECLKREGLQKRWLHIMNKLKDVYHGEIRNCAGSIHMTQLPKFVTSPGINLRGEIHTDCY